MYGLIIYSGMQARRSQQWLTRLKVQIHQQFSLHCIRLALIYLIVHCIISMPYKQVTSKRPYPVFTLKTEKLYFGFSFVTDTYKTKLEMFTPPSMWTSVK